MANPYLVGRSSDSNDCSRRDEELNPWSSVSNFEEAFFISSRLTTTSKSLGTIWMLGSAMVTRPVAVNVFEVG